MLSLHLTRRASQSKKHLAKAELTANVKLAEIVEDRARLQVLAYVDNPAVQSQLAFSIRNFARFYRATEDFYRRYLSRCALQPRVNPSRHSLDL
jgi:hypothetical protein